MEQENKEKHQQTLFQLLMFRYYPYWPLFAILVVFMLGFAWVYLQIATPVYKSTATILIKDEKKGVENTEVVESLNIYITKKIVENEIEVIKSTELVTEVISTLGLSAQIFEEFLFTSRPAYSTSPIVAEIKNPDFVKNTTRYPFVYNEISNTVFLGSKEFKLNEWVNLKGHIIRFNKNPNLTFEGQGPFVLELSNPFELVEAYRNNLSISPSNKLSTVINLQVEDISQQRAKDFLNTLLLKYNEAEVRQKNILADHTLKIIESRISLIEKDLDSIEYLIQHYKSSYGITDLDEQSKLFLTNVGQNDQKLSEINMKIAALSKIEEYILKPGSKSGIVTNTMGLVNEALSEMVNKLYDVENRYEQLKNTTAENNPIILSLQNQISGMSKTILDYIQNQKANLNASFNDLDQTNNKYTSIIKTLPLRERELLEINRQQFIKNNVYTFLLQKREETALSFASNVADNRIIDSATSPTQPISPRKIIIFSLAVSLAIIIGIILIIIKDNLSDKVLFRTDIENNTSIPIVGEISLFKQKDLISTKDKNRVILSDQLRQIRVMSGLYGKNSKKIVLVTSGISGEGKSFVSYNLAKSLANSKRKTLLIDFDLRNPNLSQKFNLLNQEGLSEYLIEKRSLDCLISNTNDPNLFILGAGNISSNPLEAIINSDFEEMFSELTSKFDKIVIDTAPIGPVSDAYILEPFCDLTLFIIKHGKTPIASIQEISKINTESFSKIAIIFNAVPSRGFMTKATGYGYGKTSIDSYVKTVMA